MDACTIIAKNYLAYARVLARSYLDQHPGSRFCVLFVDDIEDRFYPAAEPFEVVTIDDLAIDGFGRMAAMYDVLELSTAVKPWLLRWMLDREGSDGVVYLDPDIRLYAPIGDVFDHVRRDGLVLSPHNLDAMPRDGQRPSEEDILVAGVYNLGFIGLAPGEAADALLEWWSERLRIDCIVDPPRGLFVDQRWADFMPAMADRFHLLRDPGFNVAYWNLASRPVSHRDGAWYVAGEVPLRLFHFSGYDPARPHLLSKHQTRIKLSENADLARLCTEYADSLAAAGAAEAARRPYAYRATASGIPLDRTLRRFYRDLVLQGFEESPLEPDGEAAFLDVLNSPAARGGRFGVTRYLEALHDARLDLQRAYPNLDADGDAAGYLGWVQVYGSVEVPIHEALRPGPAAQPAPSPSRPPAPEVPELGVNVAGYLQSELGVGEVGRQAIEALDHVGIPTLPIGVAAPLSRQGHAYPSAAAASAPYPVNLVCVNADMLPGFAADVGERFFAGRHTIGMWWWEVSAFPERFRDAFDLVDEVWAGSGFVAEALSATATVPVTRIPTPVAPAPASPYPRATLNLPEGFLFMFMFDFHSVFARKNPLGLVEAFTRAFPDPQEGASLVLKSINAEHHAADRERLAAAASHHPHVHLLDLYVSSADRNRLLQSTDCYVSLHRSEGFGLTLAESMFMGKPVIATGYSGNLDYMTAANSYLVDHELRPIGPSADPYPPDARWAEPDLDHAAKLMRSVFTDRDEAAKRAARGAADIRRTHSLQVAGEAMAQRLRAIHPHLAPVRATPPQSAALDARTDEARRLLAAGSQPPGNRRAARLRRLPRKAVLRLMKPHTAHQRRIDDAMAAALSDVAAALGQLHQAQRAAAMSDSAMLRELRSLSRRVDSVTARSVDQYGRDAVALAEHVDALIRQGEELSATQARLDVLVRRAGLVPHQTEARTGGGYPEAPLEPWTEEYNERHATFVASELEDERLLAGFREGRALPPNFATGFDERVIEFPWVISRPLEGRVLDAGSTLNHAHVLTRVRERMEDLHVVTLAPEEQAFTQLGVSYVFADLRELPFSSGTYDRVISISTLEHIGMDNEYYGDTAGAAEDPQAEARRAMTELARVARRGGDLYFTVPVGRGERYPWVRSLTLDELDDLIGAFGGEPRAVAFYRHDASGWHLTDRDGVRDAHYRDHLSGVPVGYDRTVAAEAVACVHLVAPNGPSGADS